MKKPPRKQQPSAPKAPAQTRVKVPPPRNLMPRFESFDALDTWLEEQCLKRRDEVLRGHEETIVERLMRDLDALMPLPAVPYDACEKVSTRATSISMVRYRNNDYSVPVAYAHHEVQVRG